MQFGNLVSCTNLLPGEYRICSIMPVDPIPLDWQLACFVENFEAPWLSNEAHTIVEELHFWLSDVGEVH